MRVAYFGSPVDAVGPLRALAAAGHEIAVVVTQPDRRRGRGGGTTPTPVRAAAAELGLPVLTPARSSEVVDAVATLQAEIGVVVAFGQLLPPPLLAVVPAWVNVHYSLLPRWRGAAPVERAILAGDTETGVCLMDVVAELDAGGIYARATTPIEGDDTAGSLRARLGSLATGLLVAELPAIPSREPDPQVGEATYAEKLTTEEFELDAGRSALELDRLVRAGEPSPGAWFVAGGRRVKVHAVTVLPGSDSGEEGAAEPGTLDRRTASLTTAQGALRLDVVQPEGKASMDGPAWFAGLRVGQIDPPGTHRYS